MSRTNFTKEEINSWPEGTKKCWGCKKLKALGAFHVMKQGVLGVNTYCKECRKPKSRAHYATVSDEKLLWQRAKRRAKKFNREFTISIDDIVIPERCPVLDIPIYKISGETANSPSLDRIDSSKGYTPDNIVVMSTKANNWKNNMTIDEVEMLWRYMSGNQGAVVAIKTFHETWCGLGLPRHHLCEFPEKH